MNEWMNLFYYYLFIYLHFIDICWHYAAIELTELQLH